MNYRKVRLIPKVIRRFGQSYLHHEFKMKTKNIEMKKLSTGFLKANSNKVFLNKNSIIEFEDEPKLKKEEIKPVEYYVGPGAFQPKQKESLLSRFLNYISI